jgi:hypothetical protein
MDNAKVVIDKSVGGNTVIPLIILIDNAFWVLSLNPLP